MPTTKHQFIDSAGGWDAETSYHRIFDPRLTDYMPCVQMFGEDLLNDAYDFERSGFESVEIHLTLSGSGELEYDGKRYLLTPGSGFFINCEPYQHYWCRRGENWSCLWLHMTGGSAAKIVSTCLAQGGPIFLDEGGRIEEKLRALEAVLTANAPDQDFVLAPMLDDLLGTLLQPALARFNRQQPARGCNQPSGRRDNRGRGCVTTGINTQNRFHAFAASFLLMVPSTPLTYEQEDSLEYLRVSSTASLMETAAGNWAYFISNTESLRMARSTRDRR